MSRSSESRVDPSLSPVPPLSRRVIQAPPDLEQELLQAMQDFERGDFIELTVDQLERCAATGESPWPDESPS
jgi:hypothetical protein